MKKLDILNRLAKGKISVKEAEMLLSGKKKKETVYDILPVVQKYKGPSTFDLIRTQFGINTAKVYNLLTNKYTIGEWLSAQEIAKEVQISVVTAENIIQVLNKRGFVQIDSRNKVAA